MITMNAVVFEKDGETYVWAFKEGDEQKALDAICQAAHREDLTIDWDDANLIWQRMADAPDTVEARDVAAYLSRTARR